MLIGQTEEVVYVAMLTLRMLSRVPSRQEDGVRQDAVVCVVGFASERPLQRSVRSLFPHRGDREEMFHRGNPR